MREVLLWCLLLLLSSCSSKPSAVKLTEEDIGEERTAVYVVNHGYHTGIVVPADKIQSRLPQLKQRFGTAPYLEFGWGDKLFYPAEETTTGLTLRAVLWPTESVIHAVAIPGSVETYFPDSRVEKLCLDSPGFSSLIKFITNSFYKNEKKDIVELSNGIYGNSQFYQGNGSFYLMNTCNTWTAKGLKSAGMNISPVCKVTADSVMDYIAEYNQALKNMSSERVKSPPACR